VDPVFAYGSYGILIERLQRGLSETKVTDSGGHKIPALDAQNVDGRFGAATRIAVRLVQKELKKPQTGTVGAALWKTITGENWPSEFERSLNLLAAFEGHGYTKAAGNWDGAGITWGVIGFTLISGGEPNSLPRLLKAINDAHAQHVKNAFGEPNAKELIAVLAGNGVEMLAYSNKITDLSKKSKDPNKIAFLPLLKPWQDGFDALGRLSEVQALQDKQANAEYYLPALVDAKEFAVQFPALNCEQTRQLLFDIHVNNGAPTAAVKQKMSDAAAASGPNASVTDMLLAMSEAFAMSKHEKFRKDIRERKGAISRGHGTVHKGAFKLDDWGIQIEEPPQKLPLSLGVLSFEPYQVGEQFDLAKGASLFVNSETAAAYAGSWPSASGTELLSRTESGVTVCSLSLRPLLLPEQAGQLAPNAQALNQAVRLVFRRPVGILAVFGQGSSPSLAQPRLLFGRGPQGFAGMDTTADGMLQLFRQRLFGETPEASRMDVADVRAGLEQCQLIMLFGSHGIGRGSGENSPGRLWRQLLDPFGAKPIVLGWFGSASVPRDSDAQFVSSAFLSRLHDLNPTATLEELCAKQGNKVVELWGQACYATFGSGRQRFLWRDSPFAGVFEEDSPFGSLGLTGAAGIGRNGQHFCARKGYTGKGDAMELVP